MTIEIPNEDVPPGLTEGMIRALITYAASDEVGTRLEIEQVSSEEHEIRVDRPATYYERVESRR